MVINQSILNGGQNLLLRPDAHRGNLPTPGRSLAASSSQMGRTARWATCAIRGGLAGDQALDRT